MTRREIERRVDRVFRSKGVGDLTSSYGSWADDYDADMQALGYRNPAVVAGLAARHVEPGDGAILDAGAGTGLLGELLAILGYRNLVALDLSEAMLGVARGKGVYRGCRTGRLGEPLELASGAFSAVVCCGTFTAGHAPPSALDELIRATAPGGHLVFTVESSAYLEGGFREKIETLEKDGRWRRIEETAPYRPMPLGIEEAARTTRAFVCRVARR